MRIEVKSLFAALVAGASVMAMQSPVAAEVIVLPPMSQDPVAEGIQPTNEDELLALNNKGKEFGVPLPYLSLPALAGSLGLKFNGSPPATTTAQFGGYAIGMYADVRLANTIKLKSGRVAASYISPDGRTSSSEVVASGETPWPLSARYTNVYASANAGTRSNNTRYARGESRATDVSGIVQGLHAKAQAERRLDGSCVVTTDIRYAHLEILGAAYSEKDIAPNTTYDVPGVGQVILNEQQHVNIPGQKCGARLNTIHIKLSTAQYGLPAGADIYVGAIEAIVYG
ncbi:MAG: hypothetical protein L0H31_03335 [Nocardioidaceae bacterium]|nr:hypothetical protein [Nocardioidaceae bacterium]